MLPVWSLSKDAVRLNLRRSIRVIRVTWMLLLPVTLTITIIHGSRRPPFFRKPQSMEEPDTARAMEEEQRLDLISLAIKRLLEEKKNKKSSDQSSVDDGDGDENGDQTLLHDLLSQIKSLKEETKPEELASAVDALKTEAKHYVDDECSSGEDIVKELKKMKRQNLLTHCLLSVMIVVTVVWQFSEVSIILAVKDKISHPFRSLGNLISGVFKRPKPIIENAEKKSSKQDHDAISVLPPLQIPELPHLGVL